MPLSAEVPRIDDRRQADIVAEARTRIPRYTPEWTDLNDNEPGMAVVQLLAWMTELLIYRLGKVPQLNYVKFLELLGLELTPARTARAEITFPVRPTYSQPYVIVPLHTQVEAEEPDDQEQGGEGPVVFETERALIALTARLNAVQTLTGMAYQDVSAANADPAVGFHPFGMTARPESALLLGFESDLDFPSVEIDLAFWIKPRRSGQPLWAQCATSAPPPAEFQWEYWNGKDWYPLDVLKDDTAAFTRSGHVRLNAPPKGSLVRAAIGKVAALRYWIRVRLVSTSYQYPPQLAAVRTNTVAALHAETIEGEILGGSNGRPDQEFTLASRPVVDATLELVVDEGDGEVVWKEVEDFYASGADDAVFTLNRTTGVVRFGNGRQGRIPVANGRRPANVIARTYRVGGGFRGNVQAGRLTSLRGTLGGIDTAAIRNEFPGYGGSDEETLDEAKLRVPQTLKSHERAVTSEDFELHAREAGIARAKALPLHHPEFPGVQVPGVVSVVVIPEPQDAADIAPTPTESTLRAVCACLDPRRLATVELFVIAPRYREIVVQAEIVCSDDADLAEVKQSVLATLTQYFHPLQGGESSRPGRPGSGWPFGGGIYYSLVVQRLLVPGVKRVAALAMLLDGEPFEACTDITIDPVDLLRSGAHEIAVRYEEQP